MTSLAGKVALVTGSSRGIGRETALRLAQEGADVVVHYHRLEAEADEVVAAVAAHGRRAWRVQADLEDLEQVDRLVAEAAEAAGRLDILVPNAAATAFKDVLDVQPHHFERTYNLIVRSFVRLVQRSVPLMEGRPGRVVAISGLGTPHVLPRYSLLGSAKGAVETWVRYLAVELAPRGITVNCVSPGVIDTDSARYYKGDAFPAFQEAVARATPLGRMGTPADVAGVIAFLASEDSAYVTGQVLRVDGGLGLTLAPFAQDA
jgi:enoyl-[acyl-carrier protein] reductase III